MGHQRLAHRNRDRRRFPRTEIRLPVLLYEKSRARLLTACVTDDVSPGGLLLECEDISYLATGEVVEAELGLAVEGSEDGQGHFRARVTPIEQTDAARCAVQVVDPPHLALVAPGLAGKHPTMLEIKRKLTHVAGYNVNVLIRGETGTGKDVLARQIHLASPRSKSLLVALNCPSIPDTLLESTFWGMRKGLSRMPNPLVPACSVLLTWEQSCWTRSVHSLFLRRASSYR